MATLIPCIILALNLLATGTSQQSIKLHPNSTSSPNISITTGSGTFIDASNNWNIQVITQYGSDLVISMDQNWGFHPFKPSTLNIIMDGISPTDPQFDADLIMVFSVDNNQFFSVVIHIDTTRSAYKIYPDTNEPLAETNVFDMIYSSTPDRWHRYSQNEQWIPSKPSFKEMPKWPMFFSITNNPSTNSVTYKWRDNANTDTVVTAVYTTSFATNKGFNIYLAGDSPNEQFIIKSIDISYIIQPTESPTLSPITSSPSIYPTISPTLYPTKFPTQYPSKSPTKYPTEYPSKSPIISPSQSPTKYPSQSPTKYSSQSPTKYPSQSPTKYPSQSPTKYPSKSPTVIPTVSDRIISTKSDVTDPIGSVAMTSMDETKISFDNIESSGYVQSNFKSTHSNQFDDSLSDNGLGIDLLHIIYIISALLLIMCIITGYMILIVIKKKQKEKRDSEILSTNYTKTKIRTQSEPPQMINKMELMNIKINLKPHHQRAYTLPIPTNITTYDDDDSAEEMYINDRNHMETPQDQPTPSSVFMQSNEENASLQQQHSGGLPRPVYMDDIDESDEMESNESMYDDKHIVDDINVTPQHPDQQIIGSGKATMGSSDRSYLKGDKRKYSVSLQLEGGDEDEYNFGDVNESENDIYYETETLR